MYITAIEMSTIKSALLYTAEQVLDSDVPAFEDYEKTDWDARRTTIDMDLYQANHDKAELAISLAKELDEADAEGYNWFCSKDEDHVLKVLAYHEDIGVYACEGSCWRDIGEDHIMNLATGEVLEVLSSTTDENGRVVELCAE